METIATSTVWGRARRAVLIVYSWTMILLLGGLLVETFMVYPNIFTDAPDRFGIALQFMSITGPAQYFRPFGMASVGLGVATVALCWPQRRVRWWALASLLFIAAEGAASMAYFWPLNRVLFIEGAAVHSTEMLRQAATDFQTWHWARVGLNAASAVCAFTATLIAHRTHPDLGARSAPEPQDSLIPSTTEGEPS